MVYDYAKRQMIGMQFEPFTYKTPTNVYTWQPSNFLKSLCVATVSTPLSQLLFNWFVKVEVR